MQNLPNPSEPRTKINAVKSEKTQLFFLVTQLGNQDSSVNNLAGEYPYRAKGSTMTWSISRQSMIHRAACIRSRLLRLDQYPNMELQLPRFERMPMRFSTWSQMGRREKLRQTVIRECLSHSRSRGKAWQGKKKGFYLGEACISEWTLMSAVTVSQIAVKDARELFFLLSLSFPFQTLPFWNREQSAAGRLLTCKKMSDLCELSYSRLFLVEAAHVLF